MEVDRPSSPIEQSSEEEEVEPDEDEMELEKEKDVHVPQEPLEEGDFGNEDSNVEITDASSYSGEEDDDSLDPNYNLS